MKTIIIGLALSLMSVSALGAEITVGSKVGDAQNVSLFPSRDINVGYEINGANLTIEAFTSWCGLVRVSADLNSSGAAAQMAKRVNAATRIDGKVSSERKLVVEINPGALNCRVENLQQFSFPFEGMELIGKSEAFVEQRAQGEACERLVEDFQ